MIFRTKIGGNVAAMGAAALTPALSLAGPTIVWGMTYVISKCSSIESDPLLSNLPRHPYWIAVVFEDVFANLVP